jgi:hypothetical protein
MCIVLSGRVFALHHLTPPCCWHVLLLVVWALSGSKNAAQVLSGCRLISGGWQTRSVTAISLWRSRRGAHAVLLHVYVMACLPPKQTCSD